MITFVVIAALLRYEVRGAYVYGLLFGSLVYWSYDDKWPESLFASLDLSFSLDISKLSDPNLWICAFDLFIISSRLLSGLNVILASMVGINTKSGGNPPR